MSQVFGTLCCTHVSADTPPLKFLSMKFFLIHPGNWKIFLEGFKVFCAVLMKDKSSHIKNRKIWWQKCVSVMHCFFRNQLWWHLFSYNPFRNVNMCLLEAAMCENSRSSHFQSEWGSKKFEDWGGLKTFRTGAITDLRGDTFHGGLSTPLHATFKAHCI